MIVLRAPPRTHASNEPAPGGLKRRLKRSLHQPLITTVLTVPSAAAVSLHGGKHFATHAEGLPFGLRVAVLRKRLSEAEPVAFNAQGRPIPAHRVGSPSREKSQTTNEAWLFPEAPTSGACELNASELPGLTTLGGDTVPKVSGHRALSHAFQSCVNTDYKLDRRILVAAVLLDAVHPGNALSPLPDMTPVKGAPGFFEAPATTSEVRSSVFKLAAGSSPSVLDHTIESKAVITAERLPHAWLIVAGSASGAQRLKVLRHLHPVIHA